MTTLISRTGFLARAALITGVGVGGGVLDAVAAATPTPPRPVYLLDPTCGGCGGCSACRRHAAHALFPTSSDAELHRAHPYCKCAVVQGPDLPHETWVALFGPPAALARHHVDRRTPWVIEALAAPLAPETRSVLADPPANEPLAPAETTWQEAPPLLIDDAPGDGLPPSQPVDGLRVDAVRVGTAKRAVAIRLRLSHKGVVHATLVGSQGAIVASLRFAAPKGSSRATLRVPNGVPPGRYRVVLDVRSSVGAHRRRAPIVIG